MRRITSPPPIDDPLVTTAAELGAAIRGARCAANISIAEAAMQLGIAKQTLSNLETAQGSVGVNTALRAANEFGVSLFAVPASERELVRRAIKAVRAELESHGAAPISGAAAPASVRRRRR